MNFNRGRGRGYIRERNNYYFGGGRFDNLNFKINTQTEDHKGKAR